MFTIAKKCLGFDKPSSFQTKYCFWGKINETQILDDIILCLEENRMEILKIKNAELRERRSQ